jgi:hypothetical protein
MKKTGVNEGHKAGDRLKIPCFFLSLKSVLIFHISLLQLFLKKMKGFYIIFRL